MPYSHPFLIHKILLRILTTQYLHRGEHVTQAGPKAAPHHLTTWIGPSTEPMLGERESLPEIVYIDDGVGGGLFLSSWNPRLGCCVSEVSCGLTPGTLPTPLPCERRSSVIGRNERHNQACSGEKALDLFMPETHMTCVFFPATWANRFLCFALTGIV